MSRYRLTIVLSQASGKNPAKRALEEAIATALLLEPGLEVSIVPHLYDLGPDHTGRLFLESIPGDMVVLSWMFPRAAFWLLDRDNIKGHWGETQLKPSADTSDEDEEEAEPEPANGIGALDVRDRYIYCIDLRTDNKHDPYVEEVRRILGECRQRHEEKERLRAQQAQPALVQLNVGPREETVPSLEKPRFTPEQLLKAPDRRWYPVIDYSRCTNCLECIDFCLFGVYGVDKIDRILVENQDNCKRGCPACSRVCPEHAIVFPDHKTPAIAGAAVGSVTGLKIDLTKLFGGEVKDALQQAVLERDQELVRDGRQAVGMTTGLPKRQTQQRNEPKDELDQLMDALDELEL